MLTGIILALSRAIGETAPLVMIGALTYVAFTPGEIDSLRDIVEEPGRLLEVPFDSFTAIPLLIFNWVSRPKAEYQHVAAAAIVVLLAVLLAMNAIAIFLRHRYRRRMKW
jgi:phosphate transport system permease protein